MKLSIPEMPGRALLPAYFSAILMCLSLPFFTALCNVASLLLLVSWVCSGTVRRSLAGARICPAFLWAAAFLSLVIASLLWTRADMAQAWDILRSYRKFIVFFLLLLVFQDSPAWRERALFALFAAMVVLALVVLGVHLGLPFLPSPNRKVGAVFMKSHITQGLLMATLVVLAVRYAMMWRKPLQRAFLAAAVVLAAADSFYLSGGRTAYLCFAGAAAAVPFWLLKGWKSRLAALAVFCAAAAVLYSTSDMVQRRVQLAHSEIVKFEAGKRRTSIGQRLAFWQGSVEIIRENPVLGVGVGGWKQAYCEKDHALKVKGKCHHSNPHNEYLNVASQFGVTGFLLWAAFILSCLSGARRLEVHDRWCMGGFLGAYLAGCLANSFTTDATEGMLFAVMAGLLLAPRAGPGQGAVPGQSPGHPAAGEEAAPGGVPG